MIIVSQEKIKKIFSVLCRKGYNQIMDLAKWDLKSLQNKFIIFSLMYELYKQWFQIFARHFHLFNVVRETNS